jgi:hypothetical protein
MAELILELCVKLQALHARLQGLVRKDSKEVKIFTAIQKFLMD